MHIVISAILRTHSWKTTVFFLVLERYQNTPDICNFHTLNINSLLICSWKWYKLYIFLKHYNNRRFVERQICFHFLKFFFPTDSIYKTTKMHSVKDDLPKYTTNTHISMTIYLNTKRVVKYQIASDTFSDTLLNVIKIQINCICLIKHILIDI